MVALYQIVPFFALISFSYLLKEDLVIFNAPLDICLVRNVKKIFLLPWVALVSALASQVVLA